MAEEQTPTATVDETTTTALEPTSEATDSAPAASNGAESSEAPAADSTDAKATADDVETAGPQATTEVNPPDGEGNAEADTTTTGVDATPTAGKNGKRKSSSGVPEHKTKKLNKKKSSAQLNLGAQPGDYYWARLKGYPPWPAVICDESMLPETLLGSRPVSTKRPDGSYREDFLEGGKNARDRTYPVMFLATNEFAWMVNTALAKLSAEECSYKETDKKMTKDLKAAYDLAAEQNDLDYYKGVLQAHEVEMREYQEELAKKEAEAEAKAAAKAEKAEKASQKTPKDTKRKSLKGTAGDDMEAESADAAESKPSKKRKKGEESDGEGSKPKKTPKAAKLSAPKTPASTTKKASKPKKVVAKPDEEEDEVKTDAPLTEEEKLQRREKAVLYLRHRLQKGFLSRNEPPKDEEMVGMAEFFTQLESYADLEPQIIRVTKIHKVLKAIVKLQSIPKEEEFNFKKRSSDLLSAWTKAMDSDETAATATNGEASAETDAPAKTENTEKESTKEPSAAPAEATEAGNDAVDEADTTMTDAPAESKQEKTEETSAEPAADGAEGDKVEA